MLVLKLYIFVKLCRSFPNRALCELKLWGSSGMRRSADLFLFSVRSAVSADRSGGFWFCLRIRADPPGAQLNTPQCWRFIISSYTDLTISAALLAGPPDLWRSPSFFFFFLVMAKGLTSLLSPEPLRPLSYSFFYVFLVISAQTDDKLKHKIMQLVHTLT